MASSVALVSKRSSNQTAPSPELHPSVSGDQDPAAALWGSHKDYTQARQRTTFLMFLVNSEFIFLQDNRSDCALRHQIKTKSTSDTSAMLMHPQQISDPTLDLPNKVTLLQKNCWITFRLAHECEESQKVFKCYLLVIKDNITGGTN